MYGGDRDGSSQTLRRGRRLTPRLRSVRPTENLPIIYRGLGHMPSIPAKRVTSVGRVNAEHWIEAPDRLSVGRTTQRALHYRNSSRHSRLLECWTGRTLLPRVCVHCRRPRAGPSPICARNFARTDDTASMSSGNSSLLLMAHERSGDARQPAVNWSPFQTDDAGPYLKGRSARSSCHLLHPLVFYRTEQIQCSTHTLHR
jgi:hypothetical protein